MAKEKRGEEKPPMEFVIGEKRDQEKTFLPPRTQRLIKFLEALPDGKMRTLHNLVGDLGVPFGAAEAARQYLPKQYQLRLGGSNGNVYGNPKTIAAYKKWKGL